MSNVALAGYGMEGQSAYRYFKNQGAHITIFDERQPENVPPGVDCRVGENIFAQMQGFDVVVRSPSVRPDRIKTDGVITSPTQEFFSHCLAPIIGVTGTKGKGTTSTLIYKMLEAAGIRAHLVGNIGVPALDELPNIQPEDYVVYELSSFQLWDLKQSPHIAVILMMEPEHLDAHTSLDEYVGAKANIALYQTPEDVTIYLPTNDITKRAAMVGTGRKIPYTEQPGAYVENSVLTIDGKPVIAVSEIALPGGHNVQNACAAITAVWQITQDVQAMAGVLTEFTGLEHRLKLVGTVNGVKYYDDSIATTPGSAIAALKAFDAPKIIILGGSDKGADFHELAREVARENVKCVLLIGLMRDKLKQAMLDAGYDRFELLGQTSTMAQIVGRAHELASSGDVVILSPACASFDMFKNYKDRGEQFIRAVQAL
jgi:UDP-N-acetylmuramoylalanine--D-glutamate ligase